MTVAAATLIIAACGSNNNADTITPTTVNSTTTSTTSPATTTTTTAPVTTSAPTTVPVTTTEATESVGSREAWLAEVDKLVVDFGLTLPGLGDPPLPDVTNPDAAVALRSIFEFEFWTLTIDPSIRWADIYTLPPTQAWVDSSNLGSRLSRVGAVFEFRGDPYVVHSSRVVKRTDAAVPPEAFDRLPEGSVVVEYESSVGAFEMITPATGEVWETFPGWDRKPRYVVMSPTESGWRVGWIGPLE